MDTNATDRELLYEIAPVFLVEGPLLLAKISNALDLGNYEALYGASHSFKGAVSHFSNEAVKYALDLQTIGKSQGDLTQAAITYEELCAEMERVMPTIRDMASQQNDQGIPRK